MATVIHDIKEMCGASDRARTTGKRIALVPTMGFLHEGHCSLIRIGRRLADLVVTTVFVNPTQFAPHEDFARYPRDFGRDVALSSDAGTDIVFAPDALAMYPPDYLTFVNVGKLDAILEGKSRPGHFRGVATVVAKLFNITNPHVAVFGQKDAQQVAVIRRMIRDLNFAIDLAVGPIVREADGLAMSSRNTYLNSRERSEAPVLFRALQLAERRIGAGARRPHAIVTEMKQMIESQSSATIDYISLADPATLEELSEIDTGSSVLVSLAARFGSTRLIDNIVVTA